MRIVRFWENQIPLVRSNLSIGGGIFGGVLVLQLLLQMAVRVLSIEQVFNYLPSPLDILVILTQLLFVLLGLNALRVTYQYIFNRGVLTLTGVTLAWLSLVLVVGAYVARPHLAQTYISYAGGRSFGSIHDDFSALCDGWQREYNNLDAESDFTLATEPLGSLAGVAEAYEVRNTVMVNFGEQPIDVGLVCVLDGQPPEDAGRAANYKFARLADEEYVFYEEQP